MRIESKKDSQLNLQLSSKKSLFFSITSSTDRFDMIVDQLFVPRKAFKSSITKAREKVFDFFAALGIHFFQAFGF